MRTINEIIIHHSGFTSSNDAQHDYNCIVESHFLRRFKGVGYHYVICRNGRLFKGRDLVYAGAHCKGHNSYSVGICLVGDFSDGSSPTSEQLYTLRLLIQFLTSAYNIKSIKPHSYYRATLCPGSFLVDLCKQLDSEYNV